MSPTSPALPPNESRGPSLLAAAWILAVIATCFCTLRVYVRCRYTKKLGADDHWMMATTFFSILFSTLIAVQVANGGGRHYQYAAEESSPRQLTILSITSNVVGTLETVALKLSITSFLLRLRPSRYYQLVIWATIVAVLITMLFCLVATVAQCQPITKLWDPAESGVCWSSSVMLDSLYTVSIVCAASWVVYIVLPIAYTWNLQIPTYTKRAIWCLMCLGLIPAVCSVLKIPFSPGLTDPDVTWTEVDYYLAYMVEINIGIVVASIPPLKPLIDSRWPRLLTGSSSRSSSGRSSDKRAAFGRFMPGKSGHSSGEMLPENAQVSYASETSKSGDDLCGVVIEPMEIHMEQPRSNVERSATSTPTSPC